MDARSALRKIALGLLGALVLPLIAKMIERWADRSGFLDDPAKGFHWLLSSIGSATDPWFFYPTICGVAGFAAGLWVDSLLKSFRETRSLEMASLGSAMQYLAGNLRKRLQITLQDWPESVGDMAPDVQSLFIRAQKLGMWTPGPAIMRLNDDGHLLIGYLLFVGKLLADGHEVEAVACSLEFQRDLGKKLDAIALA